MRGASRGGAVRDGEGPGRDAFLERIRLQLQARYRGMTVTADRERFAVRVEGAGVDVTLPLTRLHAATAAASRRTSSLIAEFVRDAQAQLVAAPAAPLSLDGLLWCVRGRAYLDRMSRAAELLQAPLPGDLVAFVAEALPGSAMRGIARSDWEQAGHAEEAVREVASANTEERFRRLEERIRTAARVPRDGWRLTGDTLFEGSVLMAPPVLRALVERAGGDVLIAVPDRSLVLACPAGSSSAAHFAQRVAHDVREAPNPCSREVLRTDGEHLGAVDTAVRSRSGGGLLAWLRD